MIGEETRDKEREAARQTNSCSTPRRRQKGPRALRQKTAAVQPASRSRKSSGVYSTTADCRAGSDTAIWEMS
eukprot:scaffold7202_cov110-Isochrysis_galbana.AAC.4